MKQLLLYKENDEFVIERINNGFSIEDDSFKRRYTTQISFTEGLRSYQLVLEEYDVITSKELESIVFSLFGVELP
jgi:hypothetical protein